MSGETVYGLLPPQRGGNAAGVAGPAQSRQFTGEYATHMEDPSKPAYSTFWERGKEYDGTNTRFFKQRDAIIGPSVADSVDPKKYLKRGEGVRHVVPPQHKEKVFTKEPLDQNGPQRPAFANRDEGMWMDGMEGFEDPNEAAGAGKARGLDGGDGAVPGAVGGYGGANGPSGNEQGTYYGEFAPVPRNVKDFVTSNIVEMSNLVPKRRKDQPQLPTDRKDFGKTPAYLSRVKGEVDQEKTFVRTLEMQKDARYQQAYSQYVYRLPEAERTDLVRKLQTRLDAKNTMYRQLPITSTSLQTSKKKAELEKDIRDIEEALKKLDRDIIVIYKDDPVNGQWTKNAALEEAKKCAAASASQ